MEVVEREEGRGCFKPVPAMFSDCSPLQCTAVVDKNTSANNRNRQQMNWATSY